MKVFISWSEKVSHSVAIVLKDWLPSVIQSVNPYVSSEDIDKGARWSLDIAGELNESAYGIICLTKENVQAPWINFEAGALGKSVDKTRVSPFLFRLERSEVHGPLVQFQSTVFEENDVLKLVKSINNACDESLEESRVEKAFGVWWPELERRLEEIEDVKSDSSVKNAKETNKDIQEKTSRVLEELLELSRANHRLLRDPESILPVGYFNNIINDINFNSRRRRLLGGEIPDINYEAVKDALQVYKRLLKFLEDKKNILDADADLYILRDILLELDQPMRYMSSEFGIRLPRDLFSLRD